MKMWYSPRKIVFQILCDIVCIWWLNKICEISELSKNTTFSEHSKYRKVMCSISKCTVGELQNLLWLTNMWLPMSLCAPTSMVKNCPWQSHIEEWLMHTQGILGILIYMEYAVYLGILPGRCSTPKYLHIYSSIPYEKTCLSFDSTSQTWKDILNQLVASRRVCFMFHKIQGVTTPRSQRAPTKRGARSCLKLSSSSELAVFSVCCTKMAWLFLVDTVHGSEIRRENQLRDR